MKYSCSNRSLSRTRKRYPLPKPRRLRVEALEPRQMLHGADYGLAALPAEGEAVPVADFSLTDTNTTSPTSGQDVSPRDFLNQVSGWYFGSAL